MSEKKGLFNDKNLFIVLAVLFVLLGVGYFISLGPLEQPEIDIDVEEIEKAYNAEETSEEDAASSETAAVSGDTRSASDIEAGVPAGQGTASAEITNLPFDMELAKKERILGDPSAPIKVTEHSSFSCGHCGNFHRNTFKQFKENYLDTGKAYLVYSDFPLNASALHATLAARCVPEDRYFEFVQHLFENQENWATETNYLNILEGYAEEYGLAPETFAACVQNKELQEALLNRIRGIQQQYQINSTPSFVINNQEVIGGALPYDAFVEAVEAAVQRIESAQDGAESPEEEPNGAQ